MSWKKCVFSNLMWATYTLITCLGIVELSAVAVNYFRGPAYMGPVLSLAIVALVALCAYLFHRLPSEHKNAVKSNVRNLRLGETIFVVLFLILGLVLRVDGIAGAGSVDGYYEAAKVAQGQNVLEFVHGAVYFYLQLLHTVFVLLGNKFTVGIWLQVILQLLAILILYFGVRKLAGVLPAIVMFLFFTCAEPAIQGALTLSPEPLYLLLFAIGLNMLASCSRDVMSPALFLLVGIWIGLIGYLDISGFLLLFFGLAIVLAVREKKTTAMVRIAAFILCVMGMLIGFLDAIFVETFISGKSFDGVMNAWWALYRPMDYGFSAVGLSNTLFWAGPLCIILCFGIFSYLYSREREHISMWMFIVCITAAAQYFGMLTEELPSNVYLLLGMTILAGAGIKACFSSPNKVETVPAGVVEVTEELSEELLEGQVFVQTKEQVKIRTKGKAKKQEKKQKEVQKETLKEVQEIQEIQEPIIEQIVEQVEEPAEEKDMGTSEIDGMKLPKYLREPGTDRVKIPKYMQEEAEQAQPRQQAQPHEPVKPSPTPQEEISGAEVSRAAEQDVRADSTHKMQEATGQTEREEIQADPQDMYGVPEKFRKQSEKKSPETSVQQHPNLQEISKQQQVEPEVKEPAPKQEENETSSKTNFIENPLPLPKPHQKKVLDYNVEPSGYDDDFDHVVDENDDFDIQ